MTTRGRLPGVILLGGLGRRWGEPKSAAHLPDGSAFLTRAMRALGPGCGELHAGGASEPVGGLSPLPDARAGVGPLGGIAAALARAADLGAPGVVLLAVDLPRMTAPGILRLMEEWRGADVPARTVVVAADDDGAQPLAGVWGVEAAALALAALDQGRLGARELLAGLAESGLAVIEVGEPELERVCGHRRPLLNVNRPEDGPAALASPICPPIVAVQGWKNSGKTSLAEGLVHRLTASGTRVMTLKRGHHFDLDSPGTDSARLTAAGSRRTVLAGPDTLAVLGAAAPPLGTGATALAAAWLADADLVVAEGWKAETVPAIEVRRTGARDHTPIAPGAAHDRILALVSDRPEEAEEGALPLDDPETLDRLVALVEDRVLARPAAVEVG